ncbi:MAG: hypothetical protein WBF37_07330, partial [Dehalococcoidia bacterium]
MEGWGCCRVATAPDAQGTPQRAILSLEGIAISNNRLHPTAEPEERAYLVAVEVKGRRGFTTQGSLDELALLAATAGARVVGRAVQR